MEFNNVCNQFIYQAMRLDLTNIDCLETLRDKIKAEMEIVNNNRNNIEFLEYILKLVESKIDVYYSQFMNIDEDFNETNSEHISSWDEDYFYTDIYDE